ncbi:MAG: methionyl-tRNA formyltransferase [Solirubrobacterales bacterium]|nr:methionyl-tRNA formyltransferase [Solirubrobacterales bacterium]
MRNVYLGTSDFATTVLAKLLDSPHAPSLVVTRPARPKGRGKRLQDPPVADLANDRGVPVFQPESVNDPDAVERIAAETPGAITICAFGAIVKEPLLSMAPSFNVHPSLLPRWRGAAPVERAIQAGDAQTGVTIMRLVEELDAGPMFAQEALDIGPEDNYGKLAPQLAEIGGRMLSEAMTAAQTGAGVWTEQLDGHDEAEITYAEKILREDRLLLPRTQSAVQLDRTIRALTPHIGAMFETEGGDPLRVEAARVDDRALPPGMSAAEDGRLLIGTTDMTLELLRVRPAGGKTMDVESFLRGNDAPAIVG